MSFIDEKLTHLGATIALEGDRTREAFAAGLAQTKEGLKVTGSRPVPFRPAQVVPVAGRLAGWSLLAGAAAATVILHDGQTADGDVIAVLALPAGTSNSRPIPGAGVTFVHGVFAEVTGGPVTGALWIGAVD